MIKWLKCYWFPAVFVGTIVFIGGIFLTEWAYKDFQIYKNWEIAKREKCTEICQWRGFHTGKVIKEHDEENTLICGCYPKPVKAVLSVVNMNEIKTRRHK